MTKGTTDMGNENCSHAMVGVSSTGVCMAARKLAGESVPGGGSQTSRQPTDCLSQREEQVGVRTGTEGRERSKAPALAGCEADQSTQEGCERERVTLKKGQTDTAAETYGASPSCEESAKAAEAEAWSKASGEERQDEGGLETVLETGRRRKNGLVQLGGCFHATELVSQEDFSGGLTTVMLRNIPNKYTQEMMVSLLNETYKGLFDFFYLPIDFRNSCNVGYCFINFVHPFVAAHFKKAFHNLKLTAFKSQKICACTWGRVQGLQANIAHYRNSAVMGVPFSQYKPLLFRDGLIIPFPQAERPLPSVKPRGHHERVAKVT